jgi:3-oxoacyl-[acyl-carrier-protein] synthase II
VSHPRIVVTGLGLVTAAGGDTDATWDAVAEARSCIGPIQTFDATVFQNPTGAELLELPAAERPGDDRALRMLLAAGRQAAGDLAPRLAEDSETRRRTAVVLGTSQGSILGMADVHRRMRREGGELTPEDRDAIRAYRPGNGAGRLADALGIEGPRTTMGMVCVSSSMALLQGTGLIRDGVVDRVLAGGFEGFSPFIFTGFYCIGAASRTLCRPFDKRRDGTILGEAASLLLLETEEAARERGAEPLAILEGGGFAADGVHMTAPDREGRGMERAIRQALADSGVDAADIDYVNAHGTGTPYNDAMECKALARVLPGEMPPISSIKSIFGHTLGAAGGLDAGVSVLAMRHQVVPPTVNGGEEPEVDDWDFVFEGARPTKGLNRVLSTNAAMAGNNTALLFRRYEG